MLQVLCQSQEADAFVRNSSRIFRTAICELMCDSLHHKRNDSENENMIRLRNGLDAHSLHMSDWQVLSPFIHPSIFFVYHFWVILLTIGHLYPPHFRSKNSKIDRSNNGKRLLWRSTAKIPKMFAPCLQLKIFNYYCMSLVAPHIYDVTHVNAFKLTKGHVLCAREHVHQFPDGKKLWFILPVLRCSLKCNARWNRVNGTNATHSKCKRN